VQQHAMELPITAASSSMDHLSSSMMLLADSSTTSSPPAAFLDAPPEAGGISYSKTSYYTILALYTLSFPGLWSTIKRSTKAKVKRMTFVTPGENAPPVKSSLSSSDGGVGNNNMKPGLSLRQQAGEIMACTYNGLYTSIYT
jgi:Cofactor assembly of complex C subunit B